MLAGKISISMYSSNKEPHRGVMITLTDSESHTQPICIYLTPEQYGTAVAGMGYVDCLFEFTERPDLVGATRESKTEFIPVPVSPHKLSIEDIEDLFRPYEVDGWVGRREDFNNHHNYDYQNKRVKVVFERYVTMRLIEG